MLYGIEGLLFPSMARSSTDRVMSGMMLSSWVSDDSGVVLLSVFSLERFQVLSWWLSWIKEKVQWFWYLFYGVEFMSTTILCFPDFAEHSTANYMLKWIFL